MSALTRLTAAIRRLIFRPLFVIELRDRSAVVRSGDPPGGLLAEFSETARDLGLSRGTIYAVATSNGVTLDFSEDIPESVHQRFRNVLGIYRHRIKGG